MPRSRSSRRSPSAWTPPSGIVDVKSYYVETPEDIADRVRLCLQHAPADRLVFAPGDCGLSQTARWAAKPKLRNLVAGIRQVKRKSACKRAADAVDTRVMVSPPSRTTPSCADVATCAGDPADWGDCVWWLGQSGFLVGHVGEFLLFDPYLSDALTQKYAATDKPHVRMTARVVDPAQLGFVSVVTSSHNHTDHFDTETLGAIFAAAPAAKFVLLPRPTSPLRDATPRPAAGDAVRAAGRRRRRERRRLHDRGRARRPTSERSRRYAGFVVSVGPFQDLPAVATRCCFRHGRGTAAAVCRRSRASADQRSRAGAARFRATSTASRPPGSRRP